MGGRVRIPTVDGDVDVKVPSGAQPGDNIALRGRGIQKLRSSARGDQIVTLKIELPRSLKGKQREIIEEYASLVDEEYRSKEEPLQVKPDTPPPSPKSGSSNDTTSDKDKKEGGFFKAALGKIKGKICHDNDKKTEKDDKDKDDNKK